MSAVRDAAFARAVDEYLGWYGDPIASLNAVLAADPGHVLAYTTLAALNALGGVKSSDDAVQRPLRAATALAHEAGTREKLHLAAAARWAEGAISAAGEAWELALAHDPRDLLALHLACDTYFFLGRAEKLRNVPLAVLAAQGDDVKARGYVLGMAAFGLEESGEYVTAEQTGRAAVDINPADTWAIHAVAHVMEMQGRAVEGIGWLRGLEPHWSQALGLATHQYWHLALFLIEEGDGMAALDVYDAHIRPHEASPILDLVDAAALLWRLELLGLDVGGRWQQLAPLWGRHALDHVLAFNDIHIAFTFDAAGERARLAEQVESLAQYAKGETENAALSRELGLPLIAGMHAFRIGNFARAVARIAPLRHRLPELGGSHAQRDLFIQTLVIAALRAGQSELAGQIIAERQAQNSGTPRAFAPYLAK